MSFHTPDKNLPSWIPVKQAMGWLLAIDTFLFVGGGVSCALLLATYLPPAMGEVVWSGPLPKTTWTIVGLLLPPLGVAAYFHYQWNQRFERASSEHAKIFVASLKGRSESSG